MKSNSKRNPELYRAALNCKIGRDALDGKTNPPQGCSPTDYALFCLLHAVEDILNAWTTRPMTKSQRKRAASDAAKARWARMPNADLSPIRAVYRQREDGAYDFMAAFANDEGRWDGDVAETYAENLRTEGEEVIVKEFADLSHLVDVMTI